MRSLIIIALACLYSAHTISAGFNCNKAATEDEIEICDNPSLSSMDDSLNRLYKSVYKKSIEKEHLLSSQQEWLLERLQCRSDTVCIGDTYVNRLFELQMWGRVGDGRNIDFSSFFDSEVGDISKAEILFINQYEPAGDISLLVDLEGFHYGKCLESGPCGCGEARYIGFIDYNTRTNHVIKKMVNIYHSDCIGHDDTNDYFIMENSASVTVGVSSDSGGVTPKLIPIATLDKMNYKNGYKVLRSDLNFQQR